MNNLPFISVVIPAYNEEKYLPACLKALNNQTYPRNRYEIIVADNNSTDETVQVATQENAKVVTAQRQGYVFAVKEGVSHAKGMIIASTDADSVVPRDWLSKIADVFLHDSSVVAVTGSVTSDFTPEIFRKFMDMLYFLFLFFSFSLKIPNLSGFNMAYSRLAMIEVGGINTDFAIGADTELGKRLKRKGKVVFKPKIRVQSSARRWKKGFFKTLFTYSRAYVYTNIFHKAPTQNLPILR